jgi:hypothetical protein
MFIPHSYITMQLKIAALKIESVCSSETLVSTYKSTWRQNPENRNSQAMHSLVRRQKELQIGNDTLSKLFVCIIWIIRGSNYIYAI